MMRSVGMIAALCLLALMPLGTAAETVKQGRAAFLASDLGTAYPLLRPNADAGDGEALFMLGRLDLGGLGTARDLKASVGRSFAAGEAGLRVGHVAVFSPALGLLDGDASFADVGATVRIMPALALRPVQVENHLEQITAKDLLRAPPSVETTAHDATLRGWFTFFATHGRGSPVIERLDPAIVTFAGGA